MKIISYKELKTLYIILVVINFLVFSNGCLRTIEIVLLSLFLPLGLFYVCLFLACIIFFVISLFISHSNENTDIYILNKIYISVICICALFIWNKPNNTNCKSSSNSYYKSQSNYNGNYSNNNSIADINNSSLPHSEYNPPEQLNHCSSLPVTIENSCQTLVDLKRIPENHTQGKIKYTVEKAMCSPNYNKIISNIDASLCHPPNN